MDGPQLIIIITKLITRQLLRKSYQHKILKKLEIKNSNY